MNGSRRHGAGLVALVLFAAFAVCILLVLTSGADVYRRVSARDDAAYTARTVERYLSAQLRRAPTPDCVTLTDFAGADAIEIAEDGYVTRIYCYDGYLHELFCAPDAALEPADGEPLLPLASLSGEITDGRLTLALTHADGHTETLYFAWEAAE